MPCQKTPDTNATFSERQPRDSKGAHRFNPFPVDSANQIVWVVFGDADQSSWLTTIGAATGITQAVLDENQFNDRQPEGYVFVGFPVALSLESAEKEPLPGLLPTLRCCR